MQACYMLVTHSCQENYRSGRMMIIEPAAARHTRRYLAFRLNSFVPLSPHSCRAVF